MDKKGSCVKYLPHVEKKPEVSVYEGDEYVCVEALLPEIANEVALNFSKGMLSIKTQKNEKTFSYQIAVPGFFEENTIPKATLKEGVLKVIFTKNKKSFIKKKNTR